MTDNLHGITHFSYSSASMFIADPARWYVSYVLKHREPSNPAMERGKAVEFGIEYLLKDEFAELPDAIELATKQFNAGTALGGNPEARDKERDNLPGMIEQGYGAIKHLGAPETCQEKIEVEFEGVHIPVIGYIDWAWPGLIIDCKSTTRCPSGISAPHRKQGALYRKAKGNNYGVQFLYATPKKFALHDLENDEQDLKELHRAFLCMQRLLGISRDPQEIAEYLCPNYDSFYWSNQQTREIGREAFGC
jgi:hypothetical protein